MNKLTIGSIFFVLIIAIPSINIGAVDNESIIYVNNDNTMGPWDGSPEHPFQYIQDAIDAAVPYDTIFVYEGIYYEQLHIDKAISLIGQYKQQTIIDSDKQGSTIAIDEVDYVLITNFTIKHGINPANDFRFGICINGSSDIRIISNIIINCYCGIVIQQESKDCIVLNNEIMNNDLGFDLSSSYSNLIYENTFLNNNLSLILSNSKDNYIANNIFNDGNHPVTFYNSYDSFKQNYWGKPRSIHVIFGYRSLFGSTFYIPWICCDFQAASSVDSIQSNPVAVMDTTKGTMMFELYASKTPITASNFIKLSNIGFYKNIVFHRVIDDFVIQGGGYYANGTHVESPFGTIDLEINPDIRHVDGAISMARTNDPNSATSQFFICDGAQSHLDDNYAAFGTLLVGFDVLDAISSVETKTKYNFMQDWPIDDIIINAVDILNQ